MTSREFFGVGGRVEDAKIFDIKFKPSLAATGQDAPGPHLQR